jgi:uncharacterized membrane protein YccC
VGPAFAVLGWHPPIWLVVAAVALFQGLVELVIVTNYGVAVACITVLALLLFHVAAPGDEAITATIGSRLVDTGIGAGLALILRRLLWPRATLRRLPAAQALTLQATSLVLAEAWAQQPDPRLLTGRRRVLQGALSVLRAVHADATADAGLVSWRTDTAWPVSAGVEELARLALSWPAYRPRPEPAQSTAFAAPPGRAGLGHYWVAATRYGHPGAARAAAHGRRDRSPDRGGGGRAPGPGVRLNRRPGIGAARS